MWNGERVTLILLNLPLRMWNGKRVTLILLNLPLRMWNGERVTLILLNLPLRMWNGKHVTLILLNLPLRMWSGERVTLDLKGKTYDNHLFGQLLGKSLPCTSAASANECDHANRILCLKIGVLVYTV